MVFSIAGTVTREFTFKEKNYIVESIFDKRRIERGIDQRYYLLYLSKCFTGRMYICQIVQSDILGIHITHG